MKLSRRQFLTRSAVAAGLGLMPTPLWAKDRPALSIPPLIEMGRGRPVRLDFRPAQTQFKAGKWVEAWGANGHYLAPTVRINSGDFIKLTYTNSLPQPLSINIQGLLAQSDTLGSASRPIEPNSSWSPILSVQQPSATLWYHADTMLNSAFQIYRGIAGLWLIEDNESRKATLPNRYGINDIPLILQDQLINSDGVQLLSTAQPQFFGNQLFVNGQLSPYVNVPRGWVRLRLVNASLSRHYDLQLDNGKPLWLIATGMGRFAQPLELTQIRLSPSQRVELLIDLSDGETVSLTSGAKRSFFYELFHHIEQLFQHNNELSDNVVLELRPQGLASALNQTPTLPALDLADFHMKISGERHFTIRPLDRLINRQRFDPNRIDFTAKKNSVERWHITSNEAIGFIVQGAKFILETRAGELLPTEQLAWLDTIWLEKDQAVTLLVKFEHSADQTLPFRFGVSDFMLRDRGCMGQFSVD